jgi:hypothetical protein
MHVADGSVLPNGMSYLLGVGLEDKEKWKMVCRPLPQKTFWEPLDALMAEWRLCFPEDFARKPRPFDMFKHYKTRENHLVGVYLVPAIKHIPELANQLDQSLFKNYMKLIFALRLVGSFSHKALPKVCDYFM